MDRRRDTSEVARVVKVCKDLDWKRALALHLCYVVAPSSSVSSAVSSYFNSFQVHSSYLISTLLLALWITCMYAHAVHMWKIHLYTVNCILQHMCLSAG